jgi:hypothetical protein
VVKSHCFSCINPILICRERNPRLNYPSAGLRIIECAKGAIARAMGARSCFEFLSLRTFCTGSSPRLRAAAFDAKKFCGTSKKITPRPA